MFKSISLSVPERWKKKIDAMIENKKELAENVVGAGEGWLTELSTNDFEEFVGFR